MTFEIGRGRNYRGDKCAKDIQADDQQRGALLADVNDSVIVEFELILDENTCEVEENGNLFTLPEVIRREGMTVFDEMRHSGRFRSAENTVFRLERAQVDMPCCEK